MFSYSSEILLRKLNPYRELNGERHYPSQLKNKQSVSKISKSESIQQWFIRIVKEILDGNIEICQIENNIAVFATIKWSNNQINYINFQSLITIGGNLQQYFNNSSSIEHQYFRLDLDYNSSSLLFKETVPHIHTLPKGRPRFFFDYRESKNILLDFLEFVYFNYKNDVWLDWAWSVWKKSVSKKYEEDNLTKILEASRTNQLIPNIEEYKNDIVDFKKALKREKEKVIPLPIDKYKLELMNVT